MTYDYIQDSLEVFLQKRIPLIRHSEWNHETRFDTFNLRLTVTGDPVLKDIVVYKPDGTKRQTVKFGKDFKQTMRLQGENYITGVIESNVKLLIERLDYILIDGEKFLLFQKPEFKKESTNKFTYRARFEHEFFKLRNVQFRLLGSSEYYVWSKLDGMIDNLIENANRRYPGLFVKGEVSRHN